MKFASLIIGILLIVASGIGVIVALLLPSITHNRVNFSEAMVFFIPALLVLFVGFLITVISAVFVLKARKAVR